MAEEFQYMLCLWTFYLHTISVGSSIFPWEARQRLSFSEGGVYTKLEGSHGETWVPAT